MWARTPNLGQWITPPSLPPTTYCRRLLIPNSPEWVGIVSGALRELTFASAWRDAYGISAEDAAARALVMYELYLNSGAEGDCEDMACCEPEPVLKRIDDETGRPQVSYDGGETWQPDPNDPQFGVMQLPPIVAGGTTKCDAASNALQHFTDVVNASSSNIATAGSVYALGVAMATVLLEVFIIVVTGGLGSPLALTIAAMLMGVGTSVINMGQEAFDAYWDSDAFDKVLCALYCNIGDNGQFTEDQYQAWRTQMYSDLDSSPALDFVMTTVNAGGAAGLSNMASYGGSADSDCGECGCDPEPLVYWTRSDETIVGLYPDEDGFYEVSTGSETPYAGWYGTVSFHNPDGSVVAPFANCWRVTDVTWPDIEPSLAGAINCTTGGYETPPLSSFCYAAIQWYTTSGAWSIRFKVDDTCP